MSWLVHISSAVYLAILSFKGAAALIAVRIAERLPSQASPPRASDVTVMQPILSGDPQLSSVLEENLTRLPQANFAWLIDETDRDAREVAAALIARHPDRAIEVLLFPEPPGATSPKTFKLHGALPLMNTMFCLVLDDDAALKLEALESLIGALADADLATALPGYRDGGGSPGRFLEQFVNNNAALTYLPPLPFAEALSINGMCYAFRTEVFKACDAYGPILGHLADDLALARRLRQQGLRIVQTLASVEVRTSVANWRRYRQQMHRWFLFATLLLQEQSGSVKLAIGLLHGLPPVALIVLFGAVLVDPSWWSASWLVGVLILRAAVICGFQKRLAGKIRHRLVISIASEMLQPFHLLHATFVRTIRWRTRIYRVHANDAFKSE